MGDPSIFSIRLSPLLLVLVLSATSARAQPCGQSFKQLENINAAAALLIDAQGRIQCAYHAETPLVPASTLKLLTAWAALRTWGPQARFKTEFFLDAHKQLYIKGYGDPFLVSEELKAAMAAVAKRLPSTKIARVLLDDSFFSSTIHIDGRSLSSNPYDAPSSAIAANFNTVYLQKTLNRIASAEPQTPLVPISRALGQTLDTPLARINLHSRELAVKYVGELAEAYLADNGISTAQGVGIAQVPKQAKKIYTHLNSRTLEEVLTAMLKYSTNFIANQIFLKLGAQQLGGQATVKKARQAMKRQINEAFGWTTFEIFDGAGLSRRNRLSAHQLVELLKALEHYPTLLPSRQNGIRAKTGTLKGIKTLAGYIHDDNADARFAILINEPTNARLRYDVLEYFTTQLE